MSMKTPGPRGSTCGPRRLLRPVPGLLTLAALTLLLVGCSGRPALNDEAVERVLSREHRCSASLVLRSQALGSEQEGRICVDLGAVERRFHAMFGTAGRPVAHDGNVALRANIYRTVAEFKRWAGRHFDMPVDNGGMYLEGLPDRPGNQAEFVAYQQASGAVHNLAHEFTHYLDGRFNLQGDFCANLHDSHAPPENCAQPSPLRPYLVWWTEGVAEYVAHGDAHPRLSQIARAQTLPLSELFNTGYETQGGTERVYGGGYLAVRFMMERHRPRIDQMLALTRAGDYPRYQALVRSWGQEMDADFAAWLDHLKS